MGNIELNKCVFCGAEPKVLHLDENMWYITCTACHKHDRYSCLGFSYAASAEQWNYANRPIARGKKCKP